MLWLLTVDNGQKAEVTGMTGLSAAAMSGPAGDAACQASVTNKFAFRRDTQAIVSGTAITRRPGLILLP
jgi:hypothetical protein